MNLLCAETFQIFYCHSHDGTDSPADAEDLIVVLNNFKSKIIKVKVSVAIVNVTPTF